MGAAATTAAELLAGAPVFAAVPALPPNAQPAASSTGTVGTSPTLNERIAVLEQQRAIFEREAEINAEAAGVNGFSLTSADKAFQLRVRCYMPGDARFAVDDDGERVADTFTLRCVRPGVEAHWAVCSRYA